MDEPGKETGTNSRPAWGRFGYRSVEDRYVAGVAGGLSERFGVDPFFLRAGLLAATMFLAYNGGLYGFVPVGYLVAWIILPVEDEPSILMNGKGWLALQEAAGAVALCALVLVLLANPSFLETAILAAVAFALLRDPSRRRRSARPMPAATAAPEPVMPGEAAAAEAKLQDDPEPASEPASKQVSEGSGEEGPTAKWGRTRRAERLRREPRTRRHRREPALWPTTLALLVVLTVAVATLDNLLDGGVDPAIWVNAALIVIGGIILLSAWKGRARWTMLLAVALAPLWIAFSVTDIGRFPGYGRADRVVSGPVGDEPLTFEHGYGAMDIMLLDMDLEEGDEVTVEGRLTAGELTVIVPDEYELFVTSEIGLGGLSVNGQGVDYWEHHSAPAVARTVRWHYPARARGCSTNFVSWSTVLNLFDAAGVDLDLETSEVDEEAVLATLDAIEQQGYRRPVYEGHPAGSLDMRFHDENGHHYVAVGDPIPGGLTVEPLSDLSDLPPMASAMAEAEYMARYYEEAIQAGEDPALIPTPRPFADRHTTSWYIVDGGLYDESGLLGAPVPTPTQFSPDFPAPTPPPFVAPQQLPLNPEPVIVPPVEGGQWFVKIKYNDEGLQEACKPEPVPDNPPVIHLDATVGLGSLTIERPPLR